MGTRAILAYPYRDGYKGAWVWCDGYSLKPFLNACARDKEHAKFLVKFGNISSFMTMQQLGSFMKQFPDEDFIRCKVFETKNMLDKYIEAHPQFANKATFELKSGIQLLTAADKGAIVLDNTRANFITELRNNICVVQLGHHIKIRPNDDVNYVYYKDIKEMAKCDINYIYYYDLASSQWRMTRG